MGLELEELICQIEGEFEISIPDEAAVQLTTPRMLIDWVSANQRVSKQWSRSYVEITVWQAIEKCLWIKKEDFNDDSRFIEDMGAG